MKILVTSSHGAGWSTWCSNDDISDFMLTYKPIIDYIESFDGKHDLNENHPIILKMLEDIREKFNIRDDVWLPYTGGAESLVVKEVKIPSLVEILRITNYDGKESLFDDY